MIRILVWLFTLLADLNAAPTANEDIKAAGEPQLGTFRIRQLDVGQGDAALITTAEGRHILIDAGPTAHGVADMLKKERIDTLDLVIASHNHADHIGGMPSVFSAVSVRAYVWNGMPHTTGVYRRTLTAVENEPALRYIRATSRTITLGSTSIRILPLAGTGSQNNNSVGIIFTYGRFRALYTGDSETRELSHWLRQHDVPKVSFVKVAHHGSQNGTTSAWVRATSPSVVVISVGSNNRYGHPSAGVERQWAAAGARVYRTDRDGSVELKATPDGQITVDPHLPERQLP